MTLFLNDRYELLLDGFLGGSHLLGKTLYGALFAAHAERLAKQLVLILSECMTQKAVDLFRQFKPRRTFQCERVMGVDNCIQTAVILPSVLHLHQQVLFVM